MNGPERLAVWLYGTLIAEITRTRNNRIEMRFTEEALDRFGPDSPILSTSLLVREERYSNAATRDFFEGLLPEGEARNQIVRNLNDGRSEDRRLDPTDTFGLLAEIGRESAGALVVQPGNDPPSTQLISDVPSISNDLVAEIIANLPQFPLGVDIPRGIRLSLPGIQRKLPLVRRTDGRWAIPTDGAPSTHILKPQIADTRFPKSVENEYFCMKLAARAGLSVAKVELEQLGGKRVLVVERFDRRLANGRLQRIHQEDACQALGIRPKYEQDGGPSFRRLAGVLSSFERKDELAPLLTLATFNMIIGNADAHGKNYSILHDELGQIALAPAYDLMSTVLYPDIDTVLGMYLDNVRQIQRVERNRIVNEGESWGLTRTEADRAVSDTIMRVAEALAHPVDLEPYEADLMKLVEARTAGLSSGMLFARGDDDNCGGTSSGTS
jgi:serine/threonine-protein kinase HipA